MHLTHLLRFWFVSVGDKQELIGFARMLAMIWFNQFGIQSDGRGIKYLVERFLTSALAKDDT